MGALVALGLVGCAVTDTGNPPLTPPDPGRMETMFLAGGSLTLRGQPGAVASGDGVMRVTDLSTARPPVDAPIAADGSFTLQLLAESDAVLRLQHVVGADRSAPLDRDASTLAAAPVASPCVSLEPALEVRAGAGDEATVEAVELVNGCDEPVSLLARVRETSPPLAVTPRLSAARLEPGARGVLSLELAPAAGAEATVLLELAGSSVGVRAITVWTAPPE